MTNDGMPKDHVDDAGTGNGQERRQESVEDRLKSRSTWLRLLFMIIMFVLLGLAGAVGTAVVVLQFFWVLFTGETKPELERLGRQIAAYYAETIEYLTFNREERPFPFDRDWPA